MNIEVSIFDRGLSERASVEVDELLWGYAAQSLDHHDHKRDPSLLSKIFCTDSVTISAVMKNRVDLSNIISKAVTKLLVDKLSEKDTIMGYKVIRGKS